MIPNNLQAAMEANSDLMKAWQEAVQLGDDPTPAQQIDVLRRMSSAQRRLAAAVLNNADEGDALIAELEAQL